jgi:gliding motility-associated-like protein
MKKLLLVFCITLSFIIPGLRAHAQTLDWSCFTTAGTTLADANNNASIAFTNTNCAAANGFTLQAVGSGEMRILTAQNAGSTNIHIRAQKIGAVTTFSYARLFTASGSLFTLSSISVTPTNVVVANGGPGPQVITVHAYRGGVEVGAASTATLSAIALVNIPSSQLGAAFANIDEIRLTSDKANAFGVGIDDIVVTVAANAPTVTTGSSSTVTVNSATLAGNVSSDGGATVSEKGIVYGTTSDPTTSNTKLTNGTGTGAISANASGLAANTTYHYRAYATNVVGTSYGADQTFTTLTSNNPPVVTASGGPATFTIPSAITIDNGITVSDADNTTLASGTVTITGNFQSAEDLLAFTAGGTGNITGSFNTTTGVLTLTSAGATATIAQWQTALRATTYQNTAASPNTTTRTVTFVVNDGSINSTPTTKNITIAVPVISTTGISALATTYGTASSAGTFNVSGVNMAAGILVTAPTGFEVSKDNITFTNTVTVGSSGNIASTQVHIRLASGINAGDYSGNVVLSSTSAVSVNVAIATSTVNKAALTITANSDTKVYGAPVPTLTVSYSGFAGTDDASSLTTQPTISTTAVTNSPVNTYPITASGAASSNYTFIYQPGTLTITPAALTITANGDSKVYGAPVPTLTVSYSGFVGTDNASSLTTQPTISTPATISSPVNTYPITASGAVSANYTFIYNPGTLTITPQVLGITVNDATKTYGAAVPVLSVSYSGFQGTDDASSLTTQPTISTTAVTNSPVNTYPITASGAASPNYFIVYNPGILTVTPAALTVTANNATKVYGAPVPTLTAGYSGFVGTDNASSLTTQPTISTTAVTNSPVNTYPITASGAVSANYTFIYNSGTLTITPAALTITANSATKVYGASGPTLTVGFSGFVGTDNASSLTTQPTISTTAVTNSPVNTYPITASGAVSSNYTFIYQPGTLTITPAALTITANSKGKAFGQALTGGPGSTEFTSTGLVNAETIGSVTITYGTGSAAGAPVNTYAGSVVASAATGGTFNSSNYTITYVAGNLTVGQAILTITANNATKTYGAAVPVLSVSYSGFVGTDDASSLTTQPIISTTAVTNSPVNTYPITASGAVSSNYTIVYQPGTLTVTRAALTITANDATKTYGAAVPVLGVSYSGFVGTDDASSLTTQPTISTTAVTNSPVNTYPITASGAVSANYTFIYNPGTLTVTPAALTITANDATKTYGAAVPVLSVSYSGFVGTDDASSLTTQPTISTTAVTNSPVNTYPITASGAASFNYTFVYNPGTLTVTPAALTITANDATKIYGAAVPVLGVSYSGFVGTDDASSLTTQPTITTTAVTGSPVNTYPITASGAVSANYTFVYNPGTLTVTRAALTITANDATKIYGAAVPVLGVSYSGFVGTDDASSLTTQPTISTTAVTGSPVNTYPITASGAVSANYTFIYNPGILTVTPTALTITANDATKIYGAAVPVLSVSYSGFVGTDDASSLTTQPTISTTAVTNSPVNTYPITASGAVSSNYTFVYNPGTLTVTPAALTITANDATKIYGAAVPVLGVSYSGFVGTDDASSLTTVPTISTTAVTNSPVNTYPITASGAVSANYTFIYNPGILTVTPAALTITANDATKIYGSANPVLSVSYSGFVGTDNASSLTTAPTISTTAVTNSPVNTYPITASGAVSANYTFIYNPGTLTVTQAALTITANDATKTYGSVNPALSVSYSGFVGTDNASSLTTQPTISTTAVTNSPVNTYPITASGAFSANYTFIYNPGTLTVTPAVLTITANDATKTYGSANPVLSVSYSGFVGTDNASSLTTAPTISTTAVTNSPVNTYPITASGAVSANYTFIYNPGTLTVTQAALTITANDATKTYGSVNPALSVSYSGFVGTDNASSLTTQPTISTTAVTNSPVNTYPITASGAVSANYTFIYNPGTLTVTPAALTITANDATKTYGSANPVLSVSYSGFVGTDNASSLTTQPTISTTAVTNSPVNTYPITASGAVSANYTFIYNPGTLTVTPAALTITANDATKTYGAAVPVLSVSYSGFVGTDDASSLTTQPTISTTAVTGSPVNTYPITASGAVSANYTFIYNQGTLTVTPAALTITANDATKTYGAAVPVLSVSYGGFVGTDNASSLTTQPTISTTAVTNSPVSTYPITASGAASANYTFIYQPGTLTVTPAALTITANDATKTYGATVPVLSVSYSGFVGTDDASSLTTQPTISTTAVTNSPVNTYPITASGAASSNYTIVYKSGVLTITSAALTITANDATKTYGSVNPALSVSYSGFVGVDDASSLTTAPTISTTAVTNSSVNTYPITASGAASSNYTIVYKPGVLTITSAALTITANNKNKSYGLAITGGAGSTAFTSTGLINSETIGSVTIAYGTGAAANAAVNTYTGSVVASAATGGTFTPGNYHITYVAGNIVVSQVTLTITANNQSKTYGAANPALNVSYSGFVNGDNSASLTTKPAVVTTATVTSAAGTYPITASGAAIANYNIIYAPGTLTVNKAMLTITADNKSRLYGTANPVLAATYNGFVNGDNSASLTAQPILKTGATTNSAPGTYSITASGVVSPNYSFNYVSGKLTVIPLSNANPVNLTLSSGTLLPAFTPANFAYNTQVDNEVDRIRLTVTFDATATAKVNGTLTPNDRPSYSIPLDVGNNTITVVVTAQDGTTTNTYTVLVYRGADQKDLIVTNILTPNGDGKNDVWSIQDIQLFPNNIVTVYDRGGRTVYTKHGYTNDWNGTYGGSPLTEGTYYYIVDLGPQQRKFKGFITIVRNR